MSAEQDLRDKLRKIESLFAGAATAGEKAAADAAAERIRARLNEASSAEKAQEYKFSIQDPWSRQLFIAPVTVRSHVAAVIKKLHVSDRAEAVRMFNAR